MAQEALKKTFSLVVIGGSSGSLDPVMKILGGLRAGFPVPVLVVMHRGIDSEATLAQVLTAKTVLKVKDAEEKEDLKPGYVYLAPADYHLLLESDNSISLDDSEKVNYSRPSIDVSIESAAFVYREKLLCIILSGANADGAKGVAYASGFGSEIIIQDPLEAAVSYMPEHALLAVKQAKILSTKKIAEYLDEMG